MAWLLWSSVSLLAAAVNEAVTHEKGFLAPDRKPVDPPWRQSAQGRRLEEMMWNAFRASEKRLSSEMSSGSDHVEATSSDTASTHTPTPEVAKHDKVTIAAAPAAAPGPSPLLAKFSVPVMQAKSPCEERGQICFHRSKGCLQRVAELKLAIKEEIFKLHHMANDHPLLNTLAIKSEVHHKAHSMEGLPPVTMSGPAMKISQDWVSRKTEAAPPPGLLPTQAERYAAHAAVSGDPSEDSIVRGPGGVPMPLLGSRHGPGPDKRPLPPDWATAGLPGAPTTRPETTAAPSLRLGPLRPYGSDIAIGEEGTQLQDAQQLSNDVPETVSQQVAIGVASALPSDLANDVVRGVDQTCTSLENITLSDCTSFVDACREEVAGKHEVLKGYRAQYRERMLVIERGY